MKRIVYAPMSENGLLYTDECGGENKERYRVYGTEAAARKNKVNKTDKVVLVVMTWLARWESAA